MTAPSHPRRLQDPSLWTVSRANLVALAALGLAVAFLVLAAPAEAASDPSPPALPDVAPDEPDPAGACQSGFAWEQGSRKGRTRCDDHPPTGLTPVTGEGPEVEVKAVVPSARGIPALAQADDGSIVRVHSRGLVARLGPDDQIRWVRSAPSLLDEWGVETGNRSPPSVPLGVAPLEPFRRLSRQPFAVEDLTGDGVEDVAVVHESVSTTLTSAGPLQESTGTLVTVLDGRTGETVWWRRTSSLVTEIAAHDGVLVYGLETKSGPTSDNHTLVAYRLEDGPQLLWRTVVERTMQESRWLEITPAGPGRIATAWTARPHEDSLGGITAVDVADGSVLWTHATDRFPMALEYDAVRDRIVAGLQKTSDPIGYHVQSFDAATGRAGDPVSRPEATLAGFDVADVQGGPGPEWLVSDVRFQLTPGLLGTRTYTARIAAWDGESGEPLWEQSTRCTDRNLPTATCRESTPVRYGLEGADGRVFTSAVTLANTDTETQAFRGDDGSLLWERSGGPPAAGGILPLDLLPRRDADRIVVPSYSLRLDELDVASGETVRSIPVLGEIYALDTADATGDGQKDLVVGGSSHGVVALDGSDVRSSPTVLWRGPTDGIVHRIQVTDLEGDGTREVVVAAASGFYPDDFGEIQVLDLTTGETRFRIPYEAGYPWTFVLGDLTGDGVQEIVVPARSVAAYNGASGDALWTFDPPEGPASENLQIHFSQPAIVDGVVVVQYSAFADPVGAGNGVRTHQYVAMGLDGETGQVAWARHKAGPGLLTRLWRSVAPAPATDHGVALSYAPYVEVHDENGELMHLWHVHVDVRDARTGQLLRERALIWGSNQRFQVVRTMPGGMHEGFLARGGSLVEFNDITVANLTDSPPKEAHMSTTDMAVADLGEQGEALVNSWTDHLQIVSSDAPGSAQILRRFNTSYFVGQVDAVDLDGDGSDEILAYPRDNPGWRTVRAYEGTSITGWDRLFRGVVILGSPTAGSDDGASLPDPVGGSNPGPVAAVAGSVAAAGAVAVWLRRR